MKRLAIAILEAKVGKKKCRIRTNMYHFAYFPDTQPSMRE